MSSTFLGNSFKQEFKEMFDDPNSTQHACDQLSRLRQGKGSVTSFATKFRRLAPETGYNDTALIQLFRNGVSDEVKDALSYSLDEPSQFESFVKLAIKIDQRLFDRKMEKGNNSHFKPSQNSGAPRSSGPSPMNLDAMSSETQIGKFKKLSKEEKQRRVDNNLCLYCGSNQHLLDGCTVKKDRKDLNLVEFACESVSNATKHESAQSP